MSERQDQTSERGARRAVESSFAQILSAGTRASALALTQVLGDLEHEADGEILHLEGVQDLGETIIELDVDDGADDLGHLADVAARSSHGCARGTGTRPIRNARLESRTQDGTTVRRFHCRDSLYTVL